MKYLLIIICLASTGLMPAQEDCPCCKEEHKQFDFWIGTWEVKNAEGQVLGVNTISKIEGGCLLMEKWVGSNGSNGTSMNYFDKKSANWNQLWVDNEGQVLKLKGAYADQKMILRSEITKSFNGEDYYNQITWQLKADGTVTQQWDAYKPTGELDTTLFIGIYHPKEQTIPK